MGEGKWLVETFFALKPKATNFVERVRSSTLILAFGSLAGALTVSASTTDSVDKLLVWAGLKKNALQLAEDDKRGEFSRALTRLAWKRPFDSTASKLRHGPR